MNKEHESTTTNDRKINLKYNNPQRKRCQDIKNITMKNAYEINKQGLHSNIRPHLWKITKKNIRHLI